LTPLQRALGGRREVTAASSMLLVGGHSLGLLTSGHHRVTKRRENPTSWRYDITASGGSQARSWLNTTHDRAGGTHASAAILTSMIAGLVEHGRRPQQPQNVQEARRRLMSSRCGSPTPAVSDQVLTPASPAA
jgi:hypothetical protein